MAICANPGCGQLYRISGQLYRIKRKEQRFCSYYCAAQSNLKVMPQPLEMMFDDPYERPEFIRAWIAACGGGPDRLPTFELGF